MEANTPYIIAVPGDTWGDEWQMTERPGTTAMTPAVPDAAKSSGWFTLSGQRLGSAPAAPGLYIHNGKKIIIKNHQ